MILVLWPTMSLCWLSIIAFIHMVYSNSSRFFFSEKANECYLPENRVNTVEHLTTTTPERVDDKQSKKDLDWPGGLKNYFKWVLIVVLFAGWISKKALACLLHQHWVLICLRSTMLNYPFVAKRLISRFCYQLAIKMLKFNTFLTLL